MKCSKNMAVACQHIVAYIAAYEDFVRRDKERQEAWERVVKAVHNMSNYDKRVFSRYCEQQIAEVVKNVATSLD